MKSAPPTPDEALRLLALRELDILDTPAEEIFDALTRMAARLLNVPIALVSLVDESRQWFKSQVGLDVTETARDIAFCAHAIHGEQPFVVQDASRDSRFADNPLVVDGLKIRAYAGVPLRTADGHALGTLCAIDPRPRHFSVDDLETLKDLALMAQREIRSREAAKRARKHAESAFRQLSEREALYQATFERAPTGIALVAPDGRWLLVNEQLCRILGRPREQLLEMTFQEVTHPEDLATDMEVRTQVLRGESDCAAREKRYLRPDGNVVWANVQITVVRETGGAMRHLVLVAEDITASRSAEQALQALHRDLERRVEERTVELQRTNRHLAESVLWRQKSETALAAREADLRAVLANAKDAYIAMDELGVVHEWNRQAEITFGWKRDVALGKPLNDLILLPAQADGASGIGLQRLLSMGEESTPGQRLELSARRKDGVVIPCEITITKLPPSGRRQFFAAFMHDISERKLAERRVAESETRLAAVVNDQTEIVCRFDADRRLTFVNEAGRAALGIGDDCVGTTHWQRSVHPEDLPRVLKNFDALTPAQPTGVIENRIELGHGITRWCEFVNRGFFDASGRLVEMQKVGRDITERKRLETQLAEASARLQDLYNHAPCGYHSLGPDGKFLQINATALSWLGCTADEAIGKLGTRDFLTEEGRHLFAEAFPRFLRERCIGPLEYDLLSRDGTKLRVSLRATAVYDAAGAFLMSRSVMFDITELHHARQALMAVNREQLLMLDSEIVGIIRLKDRRATWANKAFSRMFGYGEGELIGQSARIIYPDDESYEAFGRAAYPLLSIGETFRTQVRMKKKSGELIWVDSNGALVSAKSGESIWMMLDVTRTREHHDLVEVMAFHDSLTGLPNRALLLERLQHSTLAARRNGRNVAVCFVDLNGFKNVNDTLGHDAGDELLREIAMRLQDCVRANDTVARLGGDEFVLLLSDLNAPEESQMVLDRASEAVAREVILKDGRSAQVSASIGVAFFPSQARDAAELLGLADAAMYEAKKAHAALATGFSGPR